MLLWIVATPIPHHAQITSCNYNAFKGWLMSLTYPACAPQLPGTEPAQTAPDLQAER
jgi:hypothetical protein